ncbi:MAG: hypothetical protein ACK42Y_08195 [Candidatus Thermochlorobacter sp.]
MSASADENLAPTIPLVLFSLFELKFAIIIPALITSFVKRALLELPSVHRLI